MSERNGQPPFTERFIDSIADARYTASQMSDRIKDIGGRFQGALQIGQSRSVVGSLARYARQNPLLAVGAAFLLGAVVFGRRRRR